MLSLVLKPPDLVKRELLKVCLEWDSSWDVLNKLEVGCPCGVNEFAVDGGGPAGVVEMLLHCDLPLSGVDGVLE